MPTDPDLRARLRRILWAYPASGTAHMLLLTLVTALMTERGGLIAGGWAITATAAAPLVAIPLTRTASRPGQIRRWWAGSLTVAAIARLAAVAAVLGGAHPAVTLTLLFVGSVGHRLYAATFKAALTRLAGGAEHLAGLNIRNGTAYAVGTGTAGWAVALVHSGPALFAVAACGLALIVPALALIVTESRDAPAQTGPRLDRRAVAALARPALQACALWAVIAGFVRLMVPITTDTLGADAIVWATVVYTGSSWAARPSMRAVGQRPMWFWAAVLVAQLAPWALLDVGPWMLLVALAVAGPVLHAGQAVIEHRIGTAAPPGRQATAFTVANGALVLGGVVATPAVSWLLDGYGFTVAALALIAVAAVGGAAVVLARVRARSRVRQPLPRRDSSAVPEPAPAAR